MNGKCNAFEKTILNLSKNNLLYEFIANLTLQKTKTNCNTEINVHKALFEKFYFEGHYW